MRNVYQERRNVLRAAIEPRLGAHVTTTGGLAGLHLPYFFETPLDDVALAKDALDAGIVLRPLSMYYDNPAHRRTGMVLGFAAVRSEDIDAAAGRLCAISGASASAPETAPGRLRQLAFFGRMMFSILNNDAKGADAGG